MKVVPEIFPTDLDVSPANELELPHGIIGFAADTRAELLYLPDHLPFLWMKLVNPDTSDVLHFIVIEPGELYGMNELRLANRVTNSHELRIVFDKPARMLREALSVAGTERPRVGA